MNIDHKIWEVEQKVSKTAPITLYETTVRRLHGFQHELIDTLSKQLKMILATRFGRKLDPYWKTRGSASSEPGRRSAAKLLSKDEARRIAASIAKLPEPA